MPSTIYYVAIFEVAGHSLKCLVVDHSYIMPVGLDILSMQIPYFLTECLDECFLDILVDKDVIRCYACLSAVQRLSPCKTLRCNLDIRRLVYYAWALSSKFQNDWSQVLGRSRHYSFCQGRASGEENEVPALFEQGSVNLPVSLYDSDISLLKCFVDHLFDDL